MRWRRHDPVLEAVDAFGDRMVARLEVMDAEITLLLDDVRSLLDDLHDRLGRAGEP